MRPNGSRFAMGGLIGALLGVVGLSGCARIGAFPAMPHGAQPEPSSPEAAAIEKRKVCIGSTIASAGTLFNVLYYQASVLPDGKLAVGYFAFFSDERPWGNNWLTWTLLPAIAVDLVYTRTAFVAPGLQRALSGKGDVEGVHVLYEMRSDGSLVVESALADDGAHNDVHLTAHQVLSLDSQTPTFYSDVWSHQLGGRNAKTKADLAYVRCFAQGEILPLPESIYREFTLASRAGPAHIEALGGRPVVDDSRAWARSTPRARLLSATGGRSAGVR